MRNKNLQSGAEESPLVKDDKLIISVKDNAANKIFAIKAHDLSLESESIYNSSKK